MPSAAEAATAKSELAAGLAAGVIDLSYDQEITFTRYIRLVLPLDGFVFWVRADLVSPSAQFNSSQFNTTEFNETASSSVATTVRVKGSLHYASNQQQTEDADYTSNQVTFTALTSIQEFNDINPSVMWIGSFKDIRFAFNDRANFYQQADLYHYVGNAIYSFMETQIIDNVAEFDQAQVVSNSLPIWLAMSHYTPVGGQPVAIPMYPSFAVPDNLPPPYAAVHIVPELTQALAAAPTISRTGSHDQLAKDTVRITLYGLRNFSALDFQDCVFSYSLDTDRLGIMNMPIIRDEKRTQSELSILAQKKTFEVECSYLQSVSRDIARQLIKSVIPTYIIGSP